MLTDGSVRCWGHNDHGQLGNGNNATGTPGMSLLPIAVLGITNAATIAAGAVHTCALLTDGTVQCWGDSYWGQLGSGTTTSSSVPVAVAGITGATAIAAGSYHTCVLLTDGTIQCWGDDSLGELG